MKPALAYLLFGMTLTLSSAPVLLLGQTAFLGGELTDPLNWDSGLPTDLNPGTVGVDGNAGADIVGFNVNQTNGTIVINSGTVAERELRLSTWHLNGGVFRRSDNNLRIGGINPNEDTTIHVYGGSFEVTAGGTRLILYSTDSTVNLYGGRISANDTFHIHDNSGHSDTAVLTFHPGDGVAEFDGLNMDDPGFVNFLRGCRGHLLLREGLFIGSDLPPDVDTFEEMWDHGLLRFEGANDGIFSDHFRVLQDQASLVLSLTNETHFTGGEITDELFWDNGRPTLGNIGVLGMDGTVSADLNGLYVIQTNGTAEIIDGVVNDRELRDSTWILAGGTFLRQNNALRIGGGNAVPAKMHITGGSLQLTLAGKSLIIYGGDSMVSLAGGDLQVNGTFRVHNTPNHDDSPFLEFRPGGGTATVTGLKIDKPGYLNFQSGTRGRLTLTEGTITGNILEPDTDTFEELWAEGRLRVDGANEGSFAGHFQVTTDGTAVTLSLLPYVRITGLSGRPLELRWASEEDKLYSVWSMSVLENGNWSLLDTGIPATPPTNVFTNGLPVLPVEFLKVIQE